MESVDCVVVGAGVVGLAVARALALAGREVVILDAAEGIGTETSSRNSEVIHAGIYYPAGSFMARFCVAGRMALYAYCTDKGVPHVNCGKLIVATNAEEDAMLAGIKRRAEANGVEGMRVLTAAEAIEMEPNLSCTSALLSPATGIVDSHAFMLALQGDAENAGAAPVFFSPVTGGRAVGGGVEVDVGGAEPMTATLSIAGELRRPPRAWPRLAYCRNAAGPDPNSILREGQLLHIVRTFTVLAAYLSGAGTRRSRRSSDDRSWWSGALRPRRAVDRCNRLYSGCDACRQLLRRGA